MNELELFKQTFDIHLKGFLDTKTRAIADHTNDSSVIDYIDHAKEIVLSSGKRIRPYIAYLMYKSLGGKDDEKALKPLVSLEVFHSFGLMHDDIIDNGRLRHGKETSHIYIANKLRREKRRGDLSHIGNSQAILIGDLLFTWSQEILNLNTDFDQKTMHKIKTHFYEMAEEVALGQMLDVELTTRDMVSKDLIDEKTRLKTAGYSFVKPLQIGAALSGKDNIDIQKFCEEFGLKMGIAFQTQDDLLDITSTDEQLQKTTSSDKSQHQHTYFTYFKSQEVGKEIIRTNFNEAKDLVKNLSVNEEAKKKLFDLIEIIQNRSF